MPRLSVWYIRAALLYLAAGISTGALILANKGVMFLPQVWTLLPAHIEFLLIGWTVLLTMGVAIRILPRSSAGRERETPAWVAFGILNLGILLVGLGPVLGLPALVLLLGRLAELAGAATFAIHAWPRVRAVGAS